MTAALVIGFFGLYAMIVISFSLPSMQADGFVPWASLIMVIAVSVCAVFGVGDKL